MEEWLKQTIFDSGCFEACKKIYPDFDNFLKEKIVAIRGDIEKVEFGMSK